MLLDTAYEALKKLAPTSRDNLHICFTTLRESLFHNHLVSFDFRTYVLDLGQRALPP